MFQKIDFLIQNVDDSAREELQALQERLDSKIRVCYLVCFEHPYTLYTSNLCFK